MRDKRLDNRPTAQHELLLIRTGHHLWRWRQKAMKSHDWPLAEHYLKCYQIVWAAKEAVRVELREKWLETSKNRAAKLSVARGSRHA